MPDTTIAKAQSSTIVLRPPPPATEEKRRFHTLKELKVRHLKSQTQVQAYTRPWTPPKRTLPLPWRILIWSFTGLISLLLLFICSLAYLTSPWGENTMTSLVQNTINYYGKEHGLRIHLSSISGFWKGRIEINNLRVYDSYGPWLRITEGTVHPDWESLTKSIVASWRFKRTKYIPKSFYEQNAPLISMPTLKTNEFEEDLQQVPFDIKMDAASADAQKPSIPTQVAENQKNPLAPLAPRRSIGLATEQKPLVNNLLEPHDILEGKVVLGIKAGTMMGTFMPRFPKYRSQNTENKINMQTLFDFLPPWLAVDVAKLELVDFKFGPRSRSINFSTNIHGQINSEKLLLRSTLLAANKIATQWVLPTMQDLPDDVRISLQGMLKKLNALINTPEPNTQQRTPKITKRILGYASIDYDKGNMDIRWQMVDSLLSKVYAKGVESIWSRMRILAHVPVWPPNKDMPTQAYFIGRFGLTLSHQEQKIKSSLMSGQIFWDSDTFILRDFNLQSPNKAATILAKGSFGYSLTKGFGVIFNTAVKDLKTLAYIFGANTTDNQFKGNVDTSIYISHAGEQLFWWEKPLPKILAGSHLPGFSISPYDKSILAKSIQRFTRKTLLSVNEINNDAFHTQHSEKTQKSQIIPAVAEKTQTANPFPKTKLAPMPIPFKGENGFHFRIKVESKELQLPQGHIDDFFFTVSGKSVHEPSAPERVFAKLPPQTNEKVQNVSEIQTTLTQYPKTDTGKNYLTDFYQVGLPPALVGDIFLRFGDIFNKGSATVKSQWFLGGYQEGARMFQARLQDFALNFPGFSGDANLAFAYAIPRTKRRWPWIDGDLNLHINNWDLLSQLFESPLRADNLNFYSIFKSIVDEDGKPSQYFDSKLLTDRVDSTEFMVRHTESSAQSHHLHAMIDTMSLSVGRLREIVQKKLYYIPPKEVPLFTAKLDIASGRGGPINWNSGSGDLTITGEQAAFTVRVIGEISAVIEGLFNFRSRTLSLKEMDIKTPISKGKTQ